jgi:multiple sugar transport system ATP-binding protein
MAEVTLSGVRKAYGAVDAIHGVDIDIADGEFVVLVGPSGCGKSTLLRMIAGLETVTGGTIAIGGRVVNDLEPKHRDIAMVFQNYALYPHMTVAQNMGFSLEHRGGSKAESPSAWLGRGHPRPAPTSTATPGSFRGASGSAWPWGGPSCGSRRCSCSTNRCRTSTRKLRGTMRAEIKTLQQRLGTTTVYVTHDQTEAMGMADRIVVLQAGRVEQVGTPLDLFDRPANRFVAGFIGSPSMNFLDGAAGAARSASRGHALDPFRATMRPGGARHPARASGPVAEGGLPATVEVVETMGSDTQVMLRLGAQRLTALFHSRMALRPGEVLPSPHCATPRTCSMRPAERDWNDRTRPLSRHAPVPLGARPSLSADRVAATPRSRPRPLPPRPERTR